MNEVFSFKRFWAFLKREAVLNKKMIYIPAAILFALLAVYLWLEFSLEARQASDFFVSLTVFGAFGYVVFYSSMISKCFAEKPLCIEFLAAPASMPEKYLTKIITHFLIPLITFEVVLLVVTAVQNDSDGWNVFYHTTAAVVFLSGIFLFWGAVFRRFAAGAAILAITVFAVAVRLGLTEINFMFLDPLRVYCESRHDNVYVLFNTSAAVFFVVCAVAGYFIFSRKQLIVKRLNF